VEVYDVYDHVREADDKKRSSDFLSVKCTACSTPKNILAMPMLGLQTSDNHVGFLMD